MAKQGDPNTPADDAAGRPTHNDGESERGASRGESRGAKSEWQERSSPAADDPVSDEERAGLSVLGSSSVRGGAIPGVSDPVRDGRAGPRERADDIGTGVRKNPPEIADAGSEGGLSVSGGVAGGARGNAGRSDAGAGDPDKESASGPAEHRSTSRFDLDHPSTDVGDDR